MSRLVLSRAIISSMLYLHHLPDGDTPTCQFSYKDNDNISLDHLYDSLFMLFCLLWIVSQLFKNPWLLKAESTYKKCLREE